MNQLVNTRAEAAAIATGAFAQSTLVPIDNEPTPRLIVEPPLSGPLAQGVVFIPYRVENLRILPVGRAGRAQRVSARRPSAHHGRRPAVAVGGFRPEQHHRPGGHAARPAQGADRVGGCRRQRLYGANGDIPLAGQGGSSMKLHMPTMRNFRRDEEAVRKLSPEQFRVTQTSGT